MKAQRFGISILYCFALSNLFCSFWIICFKPVGISFLIINISLSVITLSICFLYAVFPAWNIFTNVIDKKNTSSFNIAITFDDGPHSVYTRQVMDILESYGFRGTFFVIGKKAEKEKELLSEMSKRGHQIENHSYSHSRSLSFRNPSFLAKDLEKCQRIIEENTTHRSRFFRPPFGVLSPRLALAADKLNLNICYWTINVRDGFSATTFSKAKSKIERKLVPGAIVVMHDCHEFNAIEPLSPELLKWFCEFLKLKDAKAVTLSELLSA